MKLLKHESSEFEWMRPRMLLAALALCAVLTGCDASRTPADNVQVLGHGIYGLSSTNHPGERSGPDVLRRMEKEAAEYCGSMKSGVYVTQSSFGHHPSSNSIVADIEFRCSLPLAAKAPQPTTEFTAAEHEEWEQLGTALPNAQAGFAA